MVRSTKESRLSPEILTTLKPVFQVIFNSLLYIVLLISFLLNGYLFARLQSSGQNVFLGTGNSGATNGAQAQIPSGNDSGAAQAPRDNVKVDLGDLPPLGNRDAKVKIVEFSDFQCPFCRSFYTGAYKQLKEEYIDTGKAVLYFRHFPLDFHPAANISAEASECANDQGKFWEMHDKMFDEQIKLGNGTVEYTKDDLKKWAGDLGLDTGSFNACLDSEKYKEKVANDLADGSSAGITGTPTFIVNGTELVGAQPFSAFKSAIDQKLAE